MNLRSVLNRIRRGDFHYLLGRFRIVRICYSGLQRVRMVGRSSTVNKSYRPTLFPNTDVDEVVRTIRKDAVFVGLKLPSHITTEIESFARSEPLHPGNRPHDPTFFFADVVRGRLPDGRLVPISGIANPWRSPAVQSVVEDPVLRTIVRNYLGYEPNKVLTLLGWNFASDLTDEEHRQAKHNVIDYHYDVGGFNFVYANFYIVDTDRFSGAHVMMKRSHNRKPLRMLLGSAVASEAAVRQQFGVQNEIVIEGPAGFGFVQDTSCYHRATRPTHRDRLMLAIRFS
jgi:hypothetical protein